MGFVRVLKHLSATARALSGLVITIKTLSVFREPLDVLPGLLIRFFMNVLRLKPKSVLLIAGEPD